MFSLSSAEGMIAHRLALPQFGRLVGILGADDDHARARAPCQPLDRALEFEWRDPDELSALGLHVVRADVVVGAELTEDFGPGEHGRLERDDADVPQVGCRRRAIGNGRPRDVPKSAGIDDRQHREEPGIGGDQATAMTGGSTGVRRMLTIRRVSTIWRVAPAIVMSDVGDEREQQQRDRLREHQRRHRDIAIDEHGRDADEQPVPLARPPASREVDVHEPQREERRREEYDHQARRCAGWSDGACGGRP